MTDTSGSGTKESTTDQDGKTVALEVTYTDSTPSSINYFHNTFGLMKFDVDGEVATLDSKWDRLGDGSLKDGYDRWVTTGDVLRSVQRLPFVESVEVAQTEDTSEQAADGRAA